MHPTLPEGLVKSEDERRKQQSDKVQAPIKALKI